VSRETALISARLYKCQAKKKYSNYSVPTKSLLAAGKSVWLPMLEEAGFAAADMPRHAGQIPRFFPRFVQDKLRSKGKTYFRPRLFDGDEGGGMRAICSTSSWSPMAGARHRHAGWQN